MDRLLYFSAAATNLLWSTFYKLWLNKYYDINVLTVILNSLCFGLRLLVN